MGACTPRCACRSIPEPMKALRSQSGQATVLVLGLAMVVFAVTGLAVDGTRAFISRLTLQNAADAAALAGAGELDLGGFYSSGGSEFRLDAAGARALAYRYLDARGFAGEAVVDADEASVTVVLRDEIATSFLGLVGLDALPVAAEARAEPVAGQGP
jgi:Flp pilus assembly protein TadG